MSLQPEPLMSRSNPLLAESISELAGGLQIGKWDVIVVTDGSGQQASKPGGWSAVMAVRETETLIPVCGQASHCSSQEAEVRAVFEALMMIERMRAYRKERGLRVHLISDNQNLVTGVQNTDPFAVDLRDNFILLYAGIREIRRLGVFLAAHHLPRCSNPLMVYTDKIAGINRAKMLQQLEDRAYNSLEELKAEFPFRAKKAD